MVKTQELHRNVHKVEVELGVSGSKKILYLSDIHIDSKHCRLDLLKKLCDKAKKEDALIVMNGDQFDVMGTFRDPRSKPHQVLSELYYAEKNGKPVPYLKAVVDYAYSFLKPYRENIILITRGNHETNIERRHDVDIIQELAERLSTDDHTVYTSGYSGWLYLRFIRFERGSSFTKKIYYHHGSGGNARRSKGTLKIDLRSGIYGDADVIATGHIHQTWWYPKVIMRPNQAGVPTRTIQHHISIPAMKDGYGDGYGGWEIEKEFDPLAIGAFWLNFEMEEWQGKRDVKITCIGEII